MWALVGGTFGVCLAVFLMRSSGSLAEAERAYQQLLPSSHAFDFLVSPADLPRMQPAQAEFSRHGSNAVTVTERHFDTLCSTRTVLMMFVRSKLLFQNVDGIRNEWSTDLARCALALEALGEGSDACLPTLAASFLREPPTTQRNVSSAILLAYTGPRGEQLLLAGLTNSNSRIRKAAVDGLRHSLLRKTTAPNRVLPIAVSSQAWTAATAEPGSYAWLNEGWQKWGAESAWMFATNGVWIMDAQLHEMRSPSLARRLAATTALATLLRMHHSGMSSLQSNYVSACLEVLSDPEPSERGRVAAALADVDAREPRVLAALERTLNDPNRMVREDATNALQRLKR